MTNALLLKSIPYEEFDYQTLLDAIHGYARPRMKISGMLAKGDIVRVKKGLYILGESLRRRPSVGNSSPTSSTALPMYPSNTRCTITA